MSARSRLLRTFANDTRGATAIEYGLICALIVIVIIAAMQSVSAGTISMYALITGAMSG
jgi:pilus assembly protein Flp/PilA